MDSPVVPKQEEQSRAGDNNQGQLRILSSLGSEMVKRQVQQGARSGKAYLQARSQFVVLFLRSQWVKALGVISHGSSPTNVV